MFLCRIEKATGRGPPDPKLLEMYNEWQIVAKELSDEGNTFPLH